jgi:hypothetical protein
MPAGFVCNLNPKPQTLNPYLLLLDNLHVSRFRVASTEGRVELLEPLPSLGSRV